MDALRKQASKLREQVAKQQQVPTATFFLKLWFVRFTFWKTVIGHYTVGLDRFRLSNAIPTVSIERPLYKIGGARVTARTWTCSKWITCHLISQTEWWDHIYLWCRSFLVLLVSGNFPASQIVDDRFLLVFYLCCCTDSNGIYAFSVQGILRE